MKSIFQFSDYKKFVLDRIEAAPNQGRGLRRELAEAMGCQVAYVSHVLAGDRHFSLEQAEALARFFALRAEETGFFFLLVEHNRAGTPALRKFLERQIREKRLEYLELQSRVNVQGKISEQDEATYYSSWHYQAVRVALSLPHCRTVGAISKELNLPSERVTEVLTFLIHRGIAREQGGQYFPGATRVHLASDSPHITKLHSNWRLHALRSLENYHTSDFHYSGVVSISRDDFEKVQEILRKAVVESLDVVKPSQEERLAVMNLDFYGI
jgi:uncharacterized protein (TIGR02147 family)